MLKLGRVHHFYDLPPYKGREAFKWVTYDIAAVGFRTPLRRICNKPYKLANKGRTNNPSLRSQKGSNLVSFLPQPQGLFWSQHYPNQRTQTGGSPGPFSQRNL